MLIGVGLMANKVWYVDSSVVLRALVERSPAARRWLERAIANRWVLVASRLLEVEVWRVAKQAGADPEIVAKYLDEIDYLAVDDELMAEAFSLDPPLGGADSIHMAAALRIGPKALVMATHDKQMADGAKALGFKVFDPVTDDPYRGPVA